MTHAPGLEIRSGRRGRGVFATRRFREEEVVETCPALMLDDDDVDGPMRDYIFAARQRGKVLILFGYGMLYNHSSRPNLYHRSAGRLTIEFVALRDIAAGEELTHDYGPDYWNDRAKNPR